MLTNLFHRSLSTLLGTIAVTALPSFALADQTPPSSPTIATIKSLVSGDRACYAEIVDEKGTRSTQFAEFAICEHHQNLIGKRVQLTYKTGNILAASCQGNVDCGKSDKVMLITQVSLAGTSTAPTIATIQSKTVTFTRGKKGQDYPTYKKAIVQYPTITSGPNTAVLKQVQDAIGLKQVLGQSLAELEAEFQDGGWLSSLRYKVDYNKRSIVQLTYTKMGIGAYPSTFKNSVAVDLQTGQVITAADLFSQDGLGKVVDVLNNTMQKRVQRTIARNSNQDPDLKSRLAGKQFSAKDLNKFVISEKGITFVYDFDFIHAVKAFEPNGNFFLSYEQLQPYFKAGGRLGR